jgi:tetratricopeptide (TPR) repeat protein
MRIPSFILLLLLGTAASGAAAQSDSSSASFDDLLLAARQAQGNNDYASAAADYRRAVLLRGDIPELWANLGLMQDAAGNYSEAIASFRTALRLKPSLYVPNLFLGIDELHLNHPREAIASLEKAESLNASDPQAPITLGRAYSALNNPDAASIAYQRAAALDPRNASAWYGLGSASLKVVEENSRKLSTASADSAYAHALYAESLADQGRWKQATTEAHTVLAADPHFFCAHARLGLLDLAQGQPDDAAREFDAESRSCSLAELGRARLSVEKNDDASALAQLLDLWKQDQGFARANLASVGNGLDAEHKDAFAKLIQSQAATGAIAPDLSTILLAQLQGSPQTAEASLAEPLEASKTAAAPKVDAAQAEANAGRYTRCAASLANGNHAPAALHGNPDALLLLASCAYMSGNYALASNAAGLAAAQPAHATAALYWSIKANEQLASAALSRFEQLEPDSPKTHLLLGDIYRQRRHLEDAENEYKTAASLAPHDPAPLYGLASAYLLDSKPDQALSAVKSALAISPEDADLNLLAGEIFVLQHEWTQAESYLKRSLSADHPLKPQMLPHAHALLGQVYAQTDRAQEAIAELQMGVASDEDGSLYYQLARLYTRQGNKAAAQAALVHVKDLEQKRRERAVIATEDSSTTITDTP